MLLIFGGSEDGHPLGAAFFSFADLHQLHTVGLSGQLLPPGCQLRVIGQVVIVADVESKRLLGRGDVMAILRGQRDGKREGEGTSS